MEGPGSRPDDSLRPVSTHTVIGGQTRGTGLDDSLRGVDPFREVVRSRSTEGYFTLIEEDVRRSVTVF